MINIKKHLTFNIHKIKIGIVTCIILIVIIMGLYIRFAFDKAFFNTSCVVDTEIASRLGSFLDGVFGTLFSFVSSLLLILTILYQRYESLIRQTEDSFFQMLNYHRGNVSELDIHDYRMNKKGEYPSKKGQRAFVVFKLQVRDCLALVEDMNTKLKLKLNQEQIFDIAYMVFYYGLSKKWKKYSKEILKKYKRNEEIASYLLSKRNSIKIEKRKNIGRTNQTSLSTYFRNMFNMIKLIDTDKYLDDQQKEKYIKILRAQLSNPELFILFYNLMSRFGESWIINDYINRYQLLKNIPAGYCGESYDHKKYFPNIDYEDDEYDLMTKENISRRRRTTAST